MMEIERGILVDAKGNFLGAFQWDASGPPPQFNLPRGGKLRPEDRKTLLAESVAERGMEFKRWDFRAEAWIEPDKKAWLVDENGRLRGSRRYFADQIPNVPVGWILTELVPPKTVGQKPYFDRGWKLPLKKARVERDTVINFECLREDFVTPPGVEYLDQPSLPDGTPAKIGATRDGGGVWTNPPLPPVEPE